MIEYTLNTSGYFLVGYIQHNTTGKVKGTFDLLNNFKRHPVDTTPAIMEINFRIPIQFFFLSIEIPNSMVNSYSFAHKILRDTVAHICIKGY